MPDVLQPIKPDYTQAWVRGEGYISQEGTSYWRRLREERGWTREQVYELTDCMLNPARQAEIEGEWGAGMVWEFEDLHTLAHLYGRSPGELLDECYVEKGRELLAEDGE